MAAALHCTQAPCVPANRIASGTWLSLARAAAANMDIVLEIADTFIFDVLYAAALPAHALSPAANATFASIKAEPTAYALPHATWQYEPATKYFSIQPSKYAYMSRWSRDEWQRQALTLYLITWCVPGPPAASPSTPNPRAGSSASSSTISLPAPRTSSSSTSPPSTTPAISSTRSSSR